MAQIQITTRQDARDAVASFFDALSASTLLKLANVLQRSSPDPEGLARKVLEAASDDGKVRNMPGAGLGNLVSAREGRARLDAITVDDDGSQWSDTEALGAGEMAAHLGVARTSLDNWRRAHKILALRKGVRNYVYPVRQFDRRAPLDGLDRVRGLFGDDATTWEWLVTSNRFTGDTQPLEWLRQGKIDDVVRAAEGALDYQ